MRWPLLFSWFYVDPSAVLFKFKCCMYLFSLCSFKKCIHNFFLSVCIYNSIFVFVKKKGGLIVRRNLNINPSRSKAAPYSCNISTIRYITPGLYDVNRQDSPAGNIIFQVDPTFVHSHSLDTSLYACILTLACFICYTISLHCNSIAFVSCRLSRIYHVFHQLMT